MHVWPGSEVVSRVSGGVAFERADRLRTVTISSDALPPPPRGLAILQGQAIWVCLTFFFCQVIKFLWRIPGMAIISPFWERDSTEKSLS